ncbi:MAG: class I SAM-dependent methyltransferase [Parachlamydiaceae bacterium]|nr:class I SAM-dependent methyltransferase [Parachlamydiaceae bacterium]
MLLRFFVIVFISIYSTLLSAKDIAVVSLAAGDEYQKIVNLSVENKNSYCQQHGYDFICGKESLDPSRPIQWTKIPLILKAMENPSYKWIFWTDADSLIMNLATPVEELIDEKYNFIIAKDFNGINAGQFLIKNCDWSKEFLKNIYAHTECIDHPWWSQKAMIIEFEQKPPLQTFVKYIPQRLINSYASEANRVSHNSTYRPGDFVIHFAGVDDFNLKKLMDVYSKKVINNSEIPSLEQYLTIYGFLLFPFESQMNESYATKSQLKQFNERLKQNPEIRTILEVGLNGGHSANNFFQNCPKLQKLISIDINKHPYTSAATEYLKGKYKDRFSFIEGDSLLKILEYSSQPEIEKCDLIFVDGNHSYIHCLNDILISQRLAKPNTLLWINSYDNQEVRKAVDACVNLGAIKIDSEQASEDSNGNRYWIEARYQFTETPKDISGLENKKPQKNNEIDISRYEKKVYSQNGEDGVLVELFNYIKPDHKYFVEFGVESGSQCNTRLLRTKYQWNGLMMDGSHANAEINLHQELITAENINTLFDKYKVPYNLDLLSIDLDFNDFYIWNAISPDYKPKVVVIEYNASHLPEEDKIVEYDSQGKWDYSNYFGASILAMARLGNKKGYSLVYADNNGVNLFFVRNDLLSILPVKIKNAGDIGKIYKAPKYGVGPNGGHPVDAKNRLYLSSIDVLK